MTMLPRHIVERINYDPASKRATGVRVIDRDTKQSKDLSAKVIFLCASTVATNQIMLNSTSDEHPIGFANSSGVLGKYIMDHHHRLGASGVMPGFDDKYEAGRRPNGTYVARYHNLNNETDGEFLRGFGYQGSSMRPTWPEALLEKGFGEDLKQKLKQPGPWRLRLHAFGEQLPMESNTITLHANKVDDYGIPQPHMDVRWSDNERKMRKAMKGDAVAMLEAAGATNIETFENDPIPGHCIHEMGGVRMGNDPSESVLNKFNQCHDVDNVFATDGSAFASIACQNPSLTFMALTARAADYAAQQMKEGTLA